MDNATPGHAFTISQTDTTWSIDCSPETPVGELAALMHFCKMRAVALEGGRVRLFPVDPNRPVPTSAEICDLITTGIEKQESTPPLVLRALSPSSRSPITEIRRALNLDD